jgi:anti-anti-sigma factor
MTGPVGTPWIVLTLNGELDMARTDELDEMAASALDGDLVNAIFDLSGVTFMDSSALRWLLRVQDRVEQSGGRLRLVAPEGGSLVRLLSLSGLADRFTVFSTRVEAEQGSDGRTDAIDNLLTFLSRPHTVEQATRQTIYAGDVWDRATEAGYTEWTGLGHRLTDKGRARGQRITQGSDHQ